MVPIPALAKIEKKQLSLKGYKLNNGLAVALGKTLQKTGEFNLQVSQTQQKNMIKELYLDDNGLKD